MNNTKRTRYFYQITNNKLGDVGIIMSKCKSEKDIDVTKYECVVKGIQHFYNYLNNDDIDNDYDYDHDDYEIKLIGTMKYLNKEEYDDQVNDDLNDFKNAIKHNDSQDERERNKEFENTTESSLLTKFVKCEYCQEEYKQKDECKHKKSKKHHDMIRKYSTYLNRSI